MLDSKRLSSLTGPKIDDLILVYQAYEMLKRLGRNRSGKPVTLAAVAKRLKSHTSPHYLYRCIARVEDQLQTELFHSMPGTGTEIAGTDVFKRIERLLESYGYLIEPAEVRTGTIIRIATTQILSSRLLPRPEQQFRERNADKTVLVDHLSVEPDELLETEQFEGNDIIFTSLHKRPPSRQQVEFCDTYSLTPCLLCPTGHRFKSSGFAWPELEQETVIALRERQSSPSYPWSYVEKHARQIIRVGTIIEGHSLVSAGLGVFPTHREFLTQQEEKYLEVIPLDFLGPTKIILFAPKRLDRSPEHGEALHELRRHIRQRFHYLAEKHAISTQLSKVIEKFQTFWAVRLARPPGGGEAAPHWVPARVRLEVTPSGYVRGSYRAQLPNDEERRSGGTTMVVYEVFGRARQYEEMTHMICRATLLEGDRGDHGDAQFLYRADNLPHEDFLVGVWCGREAHGPKPDQTRGLGQGLTILRRDGPEDVTAEMLNDCVRRWALQYGEWILAWKPAKTIASWAIW